jgi:hypothetical protein
MDTRLSIALRFMPRISQVRVPPESCNPIMAKKGGELRQLLGLVSAVSPIARTSA